MRFSLIIGLLGMPPYLVISQVNEHIHIDQFGYPTGDFQVAVSKPVVGFDADPSVEIEGVY